MFFVKKRNPHREASSTRRGFTLIELLVVIAIIALLIAILLPSLEAARRNAKRNVCASHIKNIGTSSRVYEADDPSGWGIPVHPRQYNQNASMPTFIGAYEWGGKSGIGRLGFAPGVPPTNVLSSKYGTRAGFGPATRPMNAILYPGGFKENWIPPGTFDHNGATNDTKLGLDLFKCAGDDGPPRGAHCDDWIAEPERSSYDHFGNSYAANLFMVGSTSGGGMVSNSPYLRPVTRIPTPARTLYYEENIGRWAWSAKREICPWVMPGVDPGPTKTVRGWHGADWTFNRVFVDSHAEYQKVYIEGTEDSNGYAKHYNNEHLSSYPPWPLDGSQGDFAQYQCIIVRGPNWQKDTMPAELLITGLNHPGGNNRPSYEDCVEND